MGLKLTLPPAALLSQAAKLGSLLVLLLLALLLPVFLRVAYGYLLFNGIVLALGIQASVGGGGGTASIVVDDEDRHGSSSTGQVVEASPFQTAGAGLSVRPDDRTAAPAHDDHHGVVPAFVVVASNIIELKIKTKEVVLKVLKKCPSTASIFFLSALNGSQQPGGEEKVRQEEEEEEDCDFGMDGDVTMSREELFANTERFIGNFRKELSMQRQ
ncbi:freezing-induced 1 [Hordeum vulgare]|nr:freezing-induced 1 [Hordeum vulgare]